MCSRDWGTIPIGLDRNRKVASILSHSPNLTELVMNSSSHSSDLDELITNCSYEIFVQNEDINYFPNLPRVSVIEIKSYIVDRAPPPNSTPLIKTLIIRATNLKQLKMKDGNDNTKLEYLIYLIQNRPNKQISISLEGYHLLTPHDTAFLPKVMSMNLIFTNISIKIKEGYFRDPVEKQDAVQTMIRTLATWLEMQTDSLTDLSVQTTLKTHFPPIQFPVLRALKNLNIEIPAQAKKEIRIPQHFIPLVPNQFPVLRKLHLHRYRENLGVFGTCSMTSVEELHLHLQRSPLSYPSWQITFPNLSSLHIEFEYRMEKFTFTTFKYILTCFTQLIHLDLEVVKPLTSPKLKRLLPHQPSTQSPYKYSKLQLEFWDLFTGNAPRSILSGNLLNANVVGKAGGAEGPANVIDKIPSLANMKCL